MEPHAGEASSYNMTVTGRTQYERIVSFLSHYPLRTPIKRADFERRMSQQLAYEKQRMQRAKNMMLDWGMIEMDEESVTVIKNTGD